MKRYDTSYMRKNPVIIAEVKTQSPFGFKSERTWDELFALAERVGDMLSIHTDRRWGGSFEILKKARVMTKKPILAKGIHAKDSDIQKAIENGADFVLIVGRIPKIHKEKCIIEPYTLEGLAEIPLEFKALWNSRDLTTGGLKNDTFDDARKIFSGWLCQASNIKTVSDIHPLADAVLVGTHLESFAKSLEKIK